MRRVRVSVSEPAHIHVHCPHPLHWLQLHNWIPESEVERVVEAYDKDQSGTLNFQEYLDVVSSWRLSSLPLGLA